jgi:hypothetical protein
LRRVRVAFAAVFAVLLAADAPGRVGAGCAVRAAAFFLVLGAAPSAAVRLRVRDVPLLFSVREGADTLFAVGFDGRAAALAA